jgi:hypothetical protein
VPELAPTAGLPVPVAASGALAAAAPGTGSISGSDSDSDSDSDEDEEQLPCPMNSGWPCACNNPGGSCEDDSPCLAFGEIGNEYIGVCFRLCDPDDPDTDNDCTATAFPASEQCLGVYLLAGIEHVCGLVCEDLYDCPVFEGCKETGGDFKLCHP